jgi:hypothetical protein
MTTAAGTMTMSDIAALAGVRRPVVSVWRKRPVVAGETVPFPDPVTARGGVEEFAGDEIVAWLERTGRGNNPEVRADAAAHLRLPTLTTAKVSVEDAITALLCLKARTGATLAALDPDGLLDLADEADPDDEVLFREVEALGDHLPMLASYVDHLTDAAYDVVGALDRVQARRAPTTAAARLALTGPARALVGEAGAALVLDLGADAVGVLDPTGACPDLVDAILRTLGERLDATASVRGDHPLARAARRSHLIRGWPLTSGGSPPGPAVVVTRFPNAAEPTRTPAEILTAVDDLQLELQVGQRALVLGPASVLCDELADPALEKQRDLLLRLGRLRAAVRLPAGLVTGRSRQRLGLWVITGQPVDDRPGDRWMATADLADQRPEARMWQDLVGDLVAAVAPTGVARAHSFRYARMVRTAQLLAQSGALVAPGAAPSGPVFVRPATQVLAIRELAEDLERTARPEGRLGSLVVRVGDRPGGMPSAALGDLVADGRIRLLPGSRLDDDLLGREGSVRIIGPPELVAMSLEAGTRVDPIALEERHPRAHRTEPGDVVFAAAPRPRAVVDHEGMAVARYPARILRCRPGTGLVPEAVAAALVALPDAARAWRTWQVPLVDPADAAALGAALRGIEEEREAAQRRLALLDALATRLIDATATRAVALEPAKAL